jgi:hypothetical protein
MSGALAMNEPPEIVIGNSCSDFVKIRPGSGHSAEGWLPAEVQVHCDGWRGAFNTEFMRGELHRLALELRRLRETLKRETRFDPLEGQLRLVFEGDGKGHIKLRGKAVNIRHSSTFLNFEIELDQSYLENIIRGLETADPVSRRQG